MNYDLPTYLFLWGSRHMTGRGFAEAFKSYGLDDGLVLASINEAKLEGKALEKEEDRARYKAHLTPETFDWVYYMPRACNKVVVLEFGTEELLCCPINALDSIICSDILEFYWESARLTMECQTIEDRTRLIICELIYPPGTPFAWQWKVRYLNNELRRLSNMFAHVSFLSLSYRFREPPQAWMPQDSVWPDPLNFLESTYWFHSDALDEYARLIVAEIHRTWGLGQNELALHGPRPPENNTPFQEVLWEKLGPEEYERWFKKRDLLDVVLRLDVPEHIWVTKSFQMLYEHREPEESNDEESDEEEEEEDEEESEDSGVEEGVEE